MEFSILSQGNTQQTSVLGIRIPSDPELFAFLDPHLGLDLHPIQIRFQWSIALSWESKRLF
jgi:hypothetical protein